MQAWNKHKCPLGKEELEEGVPLEHTSVIFDVLKKQNKTHFSEGKSLFGGSLLQKNPSDFGCCLPLHLNFTQYLVIP